MRRQRLLSTSLRRRLPRPFSPRAAGNPSSVAGRTARTSVIREAHRSRTAGVGSPDVLEDAVVRWAARPSRDTLRIRAVDQDSSGRQRRSVVEQHTEDTCHHDSDLAAVDHGRPGVPLLACRAVSGSSCPVEPGQTVHHAVVNPGRRSGGPERIAGRSLGYVRWTPSRAPRATRSGSLNAGKVVSTITNVADERSTTALRSHRQTSCGAFARGATSTATAKGLPRASYGPWSDSGTSPEGVQTPHDGVAKPLRTISAQSRSDTATFRRMRSCRPSSSRMTASPLHRVYISTDKDCVNIVHVGSIVGGTRTRLASQGRSLSIRTCEGALSNSACSCWTVRKGSPQVRR